MATAAHPERRPMESSSRSGRSPKSRGSSLRHKARSQHDVMKESEQSLHKLLEDFEEGRLNAFGEQVLTLVSASTFTLLFTSPNR